MWAISKRIFLFLATNILVMMTIGFILQILEGYFGIKLAGNKSLLLMCAVFGMAGSIISLMMSKYSVKKAMGVQIIEGPTTNEELKWLKETVHNYSRKAKLPKMPEVGIYDRPELNAFATGPSKSNSLVAVSTGLMQKMDRNAIEGVLAHEVAHIANGDMVTMTLIQGIVNTFVMFFAYIVSGILASRVSENGRGSRMMEFMVRQALFMVFGIAGSIVTSAFSRHREFRADNGGAKYAGKEKMIAALKALQNNYSPKGQTRKNAAAFSSLQISGKSGSFIKKLFCTHPPLEQRILTLQKTTMR